MSKLDEEKSLNKANGCIVTSDDEGAIAASIACSVSFLIYGSSAAALGAALPGLADHFHKSKAGFELAFSIRGLGYLFGTLSSAAILSFPSVKLSKEMMTCLALLITGIATGVVVGAENYYLALSCFFFQGIGFGGIDTMVNCVLPEVWGRRVQPWMQAVHCCFGIGAIVGPTIVGALGYHRAFEIITIGTFIPLIGLLAYKLVKAPPCMRAEHNSLRSHDENNNDTPTGSSEQTDKGDTSRIAPWHLRLLVSCFFFTYVGAETGFAGWVPTYALDENVTSSTSKAAYLSSTFWAALTLGRLLAIPAAIVISATTMIRAQLFMIVCSCYIALLSLDVSYNWAVVVCGLMGFSLSSIFPVMMTLFGDYGFAMYGSSCPLVKCTKH